MNAVLEALDREPLVALQSALRNPAAFERLIRVKYLGENPDQSEQENSPDSQESQEAAEMDEKRMVAAAQNWEKLSEPEQSAVLEATQKIYGQGARQELSDLLSQRVS